MPAKHDVSKSAGLKLKTAIMSSLGSFTCKDCQLPFPSRNKMFIHIRETHEKMTGTADNTPLLDLDRFVALNSTVVDGSIRTAGEDPCYRVVIKPQGLPTMGKTSLMRMNDLMVPGAFEMNLPYKKSIPCHRLDSSTGGLVICSKSRSAEVCIKMCFRQKLIHKRYRAIVPGRLEPKNGAITALCGGKESLTKYDVVNYTRSARYGWISTVDCWPVTGRKHQIRKHLMTVGHPILGDRRYSHASSWPERVGGKELMFLWSLEVEFPHPINTNTKEENAAISYENSIKIAREVENFASANIDTRDEDIDILSDDDDDDDNENPGPRSSILCSNGNTTSGGDLNSVENRLLILSGTQIRVEMYGIEKREKVRIAIDEPVYYETFRQCHHVEWESTCIKD